MNLILIKISLIFFINSRFECDNCGGRFIDVINNTVWEKIHAVDMY